MSDFKKLFYPKGKFLSLDPNVTDTEKIEYTNHIAEYTKWNKESIKTLKKYPDMKARTETLMSMLRESKNSAEVNLGQSADEIKKAIVDPNCLVTFSFRTPNDDDKVDLFSTGHAYAITSEKDGIITATNL